jgi:hypothetical protein
VVDPAALCGKLAFLGYVDSHTSERLISGGVRERME